MINILERYETYTLSMDRLTEICNNTAIGYVNRTIHSSLRTGVLKALPKRRYIFCEEWRKRVPEMLKLRRKIIDEDLLGLKSRSGKKRKDYLVKELENLGYKVLLKEKKNGKRK